MGEGAAESVEVEAAGGVVARRAESGEVEVAIVHRPKYDDWSLPKGKLDPEESFEAAALREVAEETGLRCELGAELEPSRYRDSKGRRKLVRWWAMRPTGGEFRPNDEVDQLRWLRRDEALRTLDYAYDRALVESLGGEADPAIDR